MRLCLPIFGVAVILVAVVLWAVGLWYHMSKPVIISTRENSSWIYPVSSRNRSLSVRSDVVVHLRFSSNASTTIYIEYPVSVYDWERFEFASNITFLDTRFVAEESGVRSRARFFYFVFNPATEPATMNLLITYEIPNNFYYIYIFLGMAFAGLGIADIANTVKRRLEAKNQNNKPGARTE